MFLQAWEVCNARQEEAFRLIMDMPAGVRSVMLNPTQEGRLRCTMKQPGHEAGTLGPMGKADFRPTSGHGT